MPAAPLVWRLARNAFLKSLAMTYPLRRTCKEVASLVVAMQDRPLGWKDRLALRFHMAICKACPRFEKQFLTMQSAMRQWRNYREDSTAESASEAK